LLAAADFPACHMILSIMYRRSPHKIADLSHGAVYCCRPMMELLFARLPKDLQLHAIKQLARFVTTTTLASVTNETALICNAAAWAAPETGVELLLKPLLGKIEEEVKHDGTAGSASGLLFFSWRCSGAWSQDINGHNSDIPDIHQRKLVNNSVSGMLRALYPFQVPQRSHKELTEVNMQ